MPIKTKWLNKGKYLEVWGGLISGTDVYLSADERKKWQAQDMGLRYVVLIDLRNCKTLPPISSLRGAAKVHPRGKAHFVLFGGGRFFQLIGETVSRFTGYFIAHVETFEEADKIADSLINAAN